MSVLAGFSQSKRICVMGSSSAWGFFNIDGVQLYPRDSGWAFKLKKHFKDLGVIDTLYNIAANSSSCYDGMPSSYTAPPGRNKPYYPFNITRAVSLRPDVIIVNYPTNQYDYLSKEEILFCLQTIKDSAEVAGIRCFITTTQPRDNFSVGERQKLKEIRDLIIERFGAFAIDFWTDVTVPVNMMNPSFNLGDQIHLTPGAHTILKNRAVYANIFFSTVPVIFSRFDAHKKSAVVALKWTTSTEWNSHHFIVQKSVDGKNFTNMAIVAAAVPAAPGNTYMAEDKTPATGNNFYRIVSVDYREQKQFSHNIKVSFEPTLFYAGEVYSNPVLNEINIRLASVKKEMLDISIHSIAGKKISSETILLDKTLIYKKDCTNLPAGRYTVSIKNREGKVLRNFIKR